MILAALRRLAIAALCMASPGFLTGCGGDAGTTPPTPDRATATGALTEGSASDPANAVWFRDRTEGSGFTFDHSFGTRRRFDLPETVTGGIALIDVDGDGDLDLYCIQGGDLHGERAPGASGNRLFRNEGGWRFVDITDAAGVADPGYGIGVAAGDVDRDGDPDLYVTNVGPDVFYRNEGDGRFVDATAAAGLGDTSFGSSAVFTDLDADGRPELFVTNYVRWSPASEIECEIGGGARDYCSPKNYRAPAPDSLYRNRGDGTFENISQTSGCRAIYGNGLGVAIADLTGDGRLDLYVANDGNPNQLWEQSADGIFHDRATRLGAAVDMNGIAEAGMGVIARDFDGDLDFDLLLTHLTGETNTLYRNDGGTFTDATALTGLAASSRDFTGFGVVAGDFDHDGEDDLFVANGRVRGTGKRHGTDRYAEPNQLFRGLGKLRFEELSPTTLADHPAGCSRGTAVGDLDNDGDLDLVVIESGGRARVLENVAPKKGASVTLTLLDEVGCETFDARLECTLVPNADGTRKSFARMAGRGGSYASSSDRRVHVGLGSAEAIETIRITWSDGAREEFGPIAPGASTIRRGNGKPVRE